MRLSVIIPCYNEEENVRLIVPELIPVLDGLGVTYEVVVVDDGSRDGTAAVVRGLRRDDIIVVPHEKNRGLGAAVRTGIAAARGELTVILDGDLTFHPRHIPELMRALDEHPEVTCVIGSPMSGGYGVAVPGWRIAISKLANRLDALLIGCQGITAVNQIFRLYRTSAIKDIQIVTDGFDVNAEILAKLILRGARCVEIPVPLTARQFGVSKLNYSRELQRHALLLARVVRWRLASLARRASFWFAAVLILGLLVRLAGIRYGLPLMLVADEPGHIFAALKMLELKTLIPALHQDAFYPNLYYPPYFAYLFLAPFAIFTGISYFFSDLGWDAYRALRMTEVTPYFVLARLVSVVLGMFTIVFIARAARTLFGPAAGVIAAFFVAVSVLHINASFVVWHWLATSCLVAATMFVVTRSEWRARRRYLTAAALAGLGVGFSVMATMLILLILLAWYFAVERRTVRGFLTSRWTYACALVFAALAVVCYLLYPNGFGFLVDVSFVNQNVRSGPLLHIHPFLSTLVRVEPVLVLAALLGCAALAFTDRRRGAALAVPVLLYPLLFLFFGAYAERYTIPLIPILAVVGGYGIREAWVRARALRPLIALLLAVPILSSLALASDVWHNDSRTRAMHWTAANVPADAKIAVYGPLMRMPSTRAAIYEQRAIDPTSLREIDRAEERLVLPPHGRHVLNLSTTGDESFFLKIEQYLRDREYRYLVLGISTRSADRRVPYFDFAKNGRLLASFGTADPAAEWVTTSNIGSFMNLFRVRDLGPVVRVYELAR